MFIGLCIQVDKARAQEQGEVSIEGHVYFSWQREDLKSMEISPLGGALGAEIRDIKLKNLDAAIIDAIRTTFHEYLVLVFPNQNLTPADQIALTENFGPVEPHPLRTRDSVAGFPQVLILENRPGRPGAPNDY